MEDALVSKKSPWRLIGRQRVSAAVLTTFLTATYAILDFNAPAEINVAILYASSVAVAGQTRSRWFLWLTTAVSVLLAYAGLAYGPQPSASVLKALYINRSFVALGLIMIAAIVHRRIRLIHHLDRARDTEAHQNRLLRETEGELRRVNEELKQLVENEVAHRLTAEESLRQAQKMEAIGQLTGGIAHDFNNVLTTVIGNLNLIENRLTADDPLRRLAGNARHGAEQGVGLVKRLLTFARQQPLDARVIEIEPVLTSVVALARPIVSATIELSLDVGANLWQCFVDQAQLEAAVLNLVINARDAISSHGRITLSVQNTNLPTEAADLPRGDYVRVSVQDNGTGMPPEVVARVFEPFFTTKPAGKGSGLGLPMAYGFAKQAGGTVRIETAPGEGTTIHLYLPRRTLPAGSEPVTSRSFSLSRPAPARPRSSRAHDEQAPAHKAGKVADLPGAAGLDAGKPPLPNQSQPRAITP